MGAEERTESVLHAWRAELLRRERSVETINIACLDKAIDVMSRLRCCWFRKSSLPATLHLYLICHQCVAFTATV